MHPVWITARRPAPPAAPSNVIAVAGAPPGRPRVFKALFIAWLAPWAASGAPGAFAFGRLLVAGRWRAWQWRRAAQAARRGPKGRSLYLWPGPRRRPSPWLLGWPETTPSGLLDPKGTTAAWAARPARAMPARCSQLVLLVAGTQAGTRPAP